VVVLLVHSWKTTMARLLIYAIFRRNALALMSMDALCSTLILMLYLYTYTYIFTFSFILRATPFNLKLQYIFYYNAKYTFLSYYY